MRFQPGVHPKGVTNHTMTMGKRRVPISHAPGQGVGPLHHLCHEVGRALQDTFPEELSCSPIPSRPGWVVGNDLGSPSHRR